MKRTLGLILISAAPLYAAPDYQLTTYGPHVVHAGHSIYAGIKGVLVGGTSSGIGLSVSGLPAGVTVSFPDIEQTCCTDPVKGPYIYSLDFTTTLRINVPASLAPGTYNLTVRGESRVGAVVETAPYSLVVRALPKAPSKPSSYPASVPIPELARWKSQMLEKGAKHCDAALIASHGPWEGGVWYYDGIRVYLQMAAYTQDPKWKTCAQYVEKSYRDGYLIPNNGELPGYRVFPHGLAMDYFQSGDLTSKQAALMLAHNWGYVRYRLSSQASRETAYAANAMMVGEDLGKPAADQIALNVNQMLGHYDQWFISKNAVYVRPFMAALTAEALIENYRRTRDPRIPEAIATGMEWLWTNTWHSAEGQFQYTDRDPGDDTGGTYLTGDLNLLLAPAYAWLYGITGDVKWRDRSDAIFAGGVKTAWLDGGKHFSQNYRLSFNYVKWRLNPETVWDAYVLPRPPSAPTTLAPGALNPRVFPNPWRKDKHQVDITFDQLSVGTTIKIFTSSGHLVRELAVTGASTPWDRKNDKGDTVASGIYLYLVQDTQGHKARGKLAVVK